MQRIIWAFVYVFVGGVIFWTPSVAVHAWRRHNFRGLDILILTILLPLISLTGVVILRRLRLERTNRSFIACSMLLGIWVLGPLFTTINATFAGAGFANAGVWKFVVITTFFFPIFTFEMSTYDGTLLAVLLTTFLLILMSRRTLENL